MRKASTFFSSAQRERVAQCVVAAEATTSCEIVPIVATSSGRYDRPEDLVGLWFAVPTAILLAIFYPPLLPEAGDWGFAAEFWGPIAALAAGIIVAFLIGAVLAARCAPLRRLFTPRAEMREETAARAKQLYYDHRIHRTATDVGVLIYVSLFERTASVVTGRTIADALGEAFATELCDRLTAGLHQGEPTETLCRVIAEAGSRLSARWPAQADDVNELPDALVLID
ncbi:MAG: hypothetical protein QM811_08370 [Pirellulales bacterium]